MFTPDPKADANVDPVPDRVNVFVKYPDAEKLLTDATTDNLFAQLPERHAQLLRALLNGLRSNNLGGELSVRPVFTSVTVKEIDALKAIAVQRCEQRKERYTPPRFENFVSISYAPTLGVNEGRDKELIQAANFLLNNIAKWDGIETVYQRHDDVNPSLQRRANLLAFAPPKNDPQHGQQAYLKPAPLGVSAIKLWAFEGGQGEGQRFIDIERAWQLNHADLCDDNGTPRVVFDASNGGTQSTIAAEIEHGTHVLGIICASHNAVNLIGMAPALASREAMSYLSPSQATSTADTIMKATAKQLRHLIEQKLDAQPALGADVVMLIEASAKLGNQRYFLPVEVYPDTFAVISLATRAGITVIEPAGNGIINSNSSTALPAALDLDNLANFLLVPEQPPYTLRSLARNATPQPPLPGAWLQLLPFEDSGAIMVGQSELMPGTAVKWARHDRSNYGSRVDCFASGVAVRTIHPGGSVVDFGGTSAASAVIAGAACCAQGVARASLGAPLSPELLRQALRDPACGTKTVNSTGPAADNIGVMPDLLKVAKAHLNGPI